MNILTMNSENLVEEINYQIFLQGFSVIKDFFDPNDEIFLNLKNIHNDLKIDNKDNAYKGGVCKIFNNIRIKDTEKQTKIFNHWLSNSLIQKVAQSNLDTSTFNIDIFQTLDTPLSEHIAQSPHFDRIPTLKFVLYINDINLERGPFFLSPGSHHWVNKKFPLPRPKHSNREFFDNTRKLPQIILSKLVPIEGKAGQLIIFNTDCIHHQGKVKDGECRIFRAHFRDPNKYVTKDQNIILNKIERFKSKILGN